MTTINPQLASTNLNRLFRAAAGATDAEGKGLANKGHQIVDAFTDQDKKIKLKGPEVERLLTHVNKLPPKEKAESIALLDFLRDRFEFDNETSAKKLLDTLPKTATPLDVGGRTRTVQQAKSEAAAQKPEATAAEIKHTDKLADNLAAAAGGNEAGEAMKAAALNARKQAFDDGDVKAKNDGSARKAYVESTAKNSGTMRTLDGYAASPWFEDRLMAFMMKNGLKFMEQMNDATSKFDDPKRLEDIREAFGEAAKKMVGMGNQLSPDGKARVAQKLGEFLKANPNLDKEMPAYRQWVNQVNESGAAAKLTAPHASPADVLKDLPPPDNAVLAAMQRSDNREVREFAAVFRAANHAEMFSEYTPDKIANMPEDELRKVHGEMKQFSSELKALKGSMPPDQQAKLKDVDVGELPAAMDPTSRQMMFQQISMMMQQYQQIMQAISEVMNKLNEMAMDPVRKIGR
jgi:hypothetical protein